MYSKIPLPSIPVSWGELIDKITILEIKSARFTNTEALKNVQHELALLKQCASTAMDIADLHPLADQLKSTNESLWDVEAQLRIKERTQTFDPDFVGLARAVMRLNDQRSRIKKQINLLLDSELIEEKSYET
jgi:Family of unknown function (DUF6165)